MNSSDILKIRNEFPMLKKRVNKHPLVYLDSAATAQKPHIVVDTISSFYKENYGTVHRAVYTTAQHATEAYSQARKKVANFLNAKDENEIIFTRGATAAINLVAHSYVKPLLEKGDEVLVTEMEHHSNIVPWQLVCTLKGAKLQVVPFLDSGDLDMKAFKKLLTKKTKFVSVAHISNTLGTINPIKELAEYAHAKGAKILVDGAQSASHMPIDVQALDCDFFAFSGHKTVGPTGVGVLYGKGELLAQMPPFEGGGDMIDRVTFEKTTFQAPPLRFEAGTPMIAQVIGLGAAIDFLTDIGMEKIFAYEQELLDYLLPCMKEIKGLKILGLAKKKSANITFTVENIHPLDIATLLDLRGIAIRSGHLCAQPVMDHYGITVAARASLAFYNTKEELDYFVKCLQDVITSLS